MRSQSYPPRAKQPHVMCPFNSMTGVTHISLILLMRKSK